MGQMGTRANQIIFRVERSKMKKNTHKKTMPAKLSFLVILTGKPFPHSTAQVFQIPLEKNPVVLANVKRYNSNVEIS